jgi:uncharacterized protein YcaQ
MSRRPVSLEQARRLFSLKQRLAGERPRGDAAGMLQLVRELGCLQLDPISVVDRTHRLVLWSRVGNFDQAELDRLMWQDRSLFEYWAHCASIVPTDDYPIHSLMMRNYPARDGVVAKRLKKWVADNDKLRRYILTTLRKQGPLPSRELTEEGQDPRAWVSRGWTSGRNVSRMLDYLWTRGEILVVGRSGGQKVWDLADRFLPDWTPRDRLTEREVVRRSAERSLRALGVGTLRHIQLHFIRYRYPELPAVLAELERAGRIVPVTLEGSKGTAYVHADDLPLLDQLDDLWSPRTVLLSPFDNLICDRQRTRQLFDFDYTIEIYTPPAKRKYGYYVLPILHGAQLIGRIDPAMDRATQTLTINSVHAEPHATRAQARAVATAIEDLAGFLGARDIRYGRRLASSWRSALR